jgi:hypothetical protein
MSFSKQELEDILRNFDEAIALRDLFASPAWPIYCQLARRRIDRLNEYYLRENLTPDAAWTVRERLKAIKEFQATMEDSVRQASDMNDRLAIQQMIAKFYERQDDIIQ